jgi:hypothetical protein
MLFAQPHYKLVLFFEKFNRHALQQGFWFFLR